MDSSSMPWQIFKKLIFLVLTLFCTALSATHQPYRDNLSQSTVEIYRALFQYIEKSEFDKIKSYLLLLKPLTTTLQQKYKIDFEKELSNTVNKKDKILLQKTLQHLVYFDVIDLLHSVTELEQGVFIVEHAKESAQTAYLSYLFISPFLQENHFTLDQDIKNKLRRIVLTLVRITPYKDEPVDVSVQKKALNEVNQWIAEIDTALKIGLELQ